MASRSARGSAGRARTPTQVTRLLLVRSRLVALPLRPLPRLALGVEPETGPQRAILLRQSAALDGLHLRVAADLADSSPRVPSSRSSPPRPFRQHAPPGPLAPGLLTAPPPSSRGWLPRTLRRSPRQLTAVDVPNWTGRGRHGPRQHRDDGLPRRALSSASPAPARSQSARRRPAQVLDVVRSPASLDGARGAAPPARSRRAEGMVSTWCGRRRALASSATP